MTAYHEQSLRGKVFDTIRNNILTGVYKNGEELREISLGEELGVSRTPVREALRQLELEELVKIIPNKGAYVTSITAKDIHDIYMIRSLLEGLCARLATRNITEEQIEEIEEILYLSEYHLNRNRKEKATHVTALDGKFHQIIYQATNSRMLEHILKDFHKYLTATRTQSVGLEDRASKSIEEHKAILEAIKAKDEDLAEKLANEHIKNVIINLNIEDI